MKRLSPSLVLLLLTLYPLFAAQVTPDQAALAAKGWFTMRGQALRSGMTSEPQVTAINNEQNEVIFYQVEFPDQGSVITSSDDELEPIIAFSDNENLGQLTPGHPLYALLKRDKQIRRVKPQSQMRSSATNQSLPQWQELIEIGQNDSPMRGVGYVSDVRVAPLLETKWNQGSVANIPFYNRFTPENSVSGCVPTAMGQIMYYHKHPTQGIGRFSCYYRFLNDDHFELRSDFTQGGDGQGGPYRWDLMTPVPKYTYFNSLNADAVGRLMYDAGLSFGTLDGPYDTIMYSQKSTGAYVNKLDRIFRNTFLYENAQILSMHGGIASQERNQILCSNLDAKYPVFLAIIDEGGQSGHAIVCDGYSYENRTLYHHMNMGWGGSHDLWYNLPMIESNNFTYDIVDTFIYNIYPEGTGGIISGRVSREDGTPIPNAIVKMNERTILTDAKGIYAFAQTSSGIKSFTVTSQTGETLGLSTLNFNANENLWGRNFVTSDKPDLQMARLQDWTDSLVLSTIKGNYNDSLLFTEDQIYTNFSFTNAGKKKSASTNGQLYLNGQLVTSFPIKALDPQQSFTFKDIVLPELNALDFGYHTLKLVLDPSGTVEEADETNNEYIKNFLIKPSALQGEILSVSNNQFAGGRNASIDVSFQSFHLGENKDCYIECHSLPEGWQVETAHFLKNNVMDNGSEIFQTFTLTPAAGGGTGQIVWKLYDAGDGAHPDTSTLLDTFTQEVEATDTLPVSPTFTATTGTTDGSVQLNWTSVDFAEEYFIYYSSNNESPIENFPQYGSPASGTSVGNVNDCLISGLTPGNTYYFVVCSKNEFGISKQTTPQAATAKYFPPPTTPALLTPANQAIMNPDNHVTLSWSTTENTQNYDLYLARGTDQFDITHLHSLDGETHEYTTPLVIGRWYWQVVAKGQSIQAASSPVYSFEVNPYGITDDLADHTNAAGIARSAANYPYYYTRYGNAVDSFKQTVDGASFTLTDSGYQGNNFLEDHFVMAVQVGDQLASPNLCFTSAGEPLPLHLINYTITDNFITFNDQRLDAGKTYYLFRKHQFNAEIPSPNGPQTITDGEKLIVLIHGANPSDNQPYPASNGPLGDLREQIENFIIDNDLSGWQIIDYNWADDAKTGPVLGGNNHPFLESFTEAAEIAHMHGQFLGQLIQSQAPNLKKLHLIGEGSGAWAVRTAASLLAEQAQTRIQITLLDPFMPADAEQPSALSANLISQLDEQITNYHALENYYVAEALDFTAVNDGTRCHFDWPLGKGYNLPIDAAFDYDNHHGPIQFYLDSVQTPRGTVGFAWQRSLVFEEYYNQPHLEGSLADHTANYDDETFTYTFNKNIFVDGNDPLTLSISGLPGQVSAITIEGETASFSWLTPQTGNFNVTITATNPQAETISDTFTWSLYFGQPSIITGEASDISDTTVKLFGQQADTHGGQIVSYGIQISESADDWTHPIELSPIAANDPFAVTFENLKRNTTYFYRAYIIAEGHVPPQVTNTKTGYGETHSFKTTFNLNQDSLIDSDHLVQELAEVGIDGLQNDKLSIYQQHLQEHFEKGKNDLIFIQKLIQCVNNTDEFVIVNIETGWNLVSTPFNNTNLHQQFSQKEMFPTIFNFGAGHYQFFEPTNEQTPLLMSPGRGYWVYAERPAVYLFSGEIPTEQNWDLQPGWNLFGPYLPMTTEELKTAIPTSKGPCFQWLTNPGAYQPTPQLNLGQGYWIFLEPTPQ